MVLRELCLILVGSRVPVVLGGASKQAKGYEGLKKLKFKEVRKFKEGSKVFFLGGAEFKRELRPLRTPWKVK